MSIITDIRLSPLAGRWYPSDPKILADSIDGYIQAAQIPDLGGKVVALISPHAGHKYSGPVAGHSFAAIKDLQPDLVIILSPFHAYHAGSILTTAHQAYQTPLGLIPVDLGALQDLESALLERTGVKLSRVRDDEEHAIEILLPFFQRALSQSFQILPLMIRNQDPALMKALGTILAKLLIERNTILAASSDLSHFHAADQALKMDQTIIDQIKDLNPEGLFDVQNNGTGAACGLGPLASMIWAAKESGPIKIHQLNYAHSGKTTGDNTRVVGYTAAVITRE